MESEQISAALRFLRSETGTHLLPDDYDANVTRIVQLHDQGKRRFSATVHWDLRNDCIEPLWLRAHLLAKLAPLETEPSGLLVITGLRQCLCPPPKRWTKRRAAKYQEVVSFIEKTALEKASPPETLTLLFV